VFENEIPKNILKLETGMKMAKLSVIELLKSKSFLMIHGVTNMSLYFMCPNEHFTFCVFH
jgi:hypothetical protein